MTWHCFDIRVAGYEFRFAGQTVRESAKTRSKAMAHHAQQWRLERVGDGEGTAGGAGDVPRADGA